MSTNLVKGQNGAVSAAEVVVSVRVAAAAELSALLVTEHGKVRSDTDFVFYNQPSGPGVRLRNGVSGQPAELVVSLAQVPAEITQIRAVITLDQAGATFGQLAPPVAVVADQGGNALYEYKIEDLQSESIVIAVELYRRFGTWKVRAVGQGYAGGFAALVTDHGVTVEDAPRPAPTPAAPPPPPPPSAAYPPPVEPTYVTPSSPYPTQPPPYPAPAQPYPAPPQPYPAQPQPTAPYSSAPQPIPAPPAQPPAAGELSRGRPVNLSKGQRVTLRKEGGVALTRILMGLGWAPAKQSGLFGRRAANIDLDAWVAMFADRHLVDVAYYGQLTSKDGSIRHSGDNLVGGGGANDDEQILVDLSRVPQRVNTLLFIVTSSQGHTFEQVSNAYCRLVDDTTHAELARYALAGGMAFTAMAMAKVFRSGGEWRLEAIGEGFQAQHPGEAVPQLGRFITVS
ncbi:TerD family protein [Nocardia seriolae]|uniref:Stress protein n=1 Tax=Nocardia seriolae TaxID=37332 RepID=A0A0B8NNC1_9NOCA|nr:TerD family protein [Nocardia seriolae]MTJ61438.1 stress protein [Nocardia seriolae]MTJ74778.1 stress protein [Nocardia seriolae]MTJ86469.1 stress protein [Nocardia seriolae]MTK30464.1 stress protein [Nocardia seriolae]MTK39408.1 stress protein [Nocardia seriolae]